MAGGKSPQGVVRLAFQDVGDAGFKLIIEDDGRGLSTEKIKETALKRGFITAERAHNTPTPASETELGLPCSAIALIISKASKVRSIVRKGTSVAYLVAS